jgi:nucleotide-binding universal stress UspA family protein
MSKRTILIPIDGSEHSIKALKWANTHFLRSTDLVVFAHVIQKEESLEDAKNLVKELGQHVTVSDMKEVLVLQGEPRAVLEKAIADFSATSVVVGSRGLGGLKSLILGSVSSYLLNHVSVPVVVVH